MRVSICIPTVNRIHYLRETIASVAAQTFPDFEIIISVNSADDNYYAQVEELITAWPNLNFKLYRQPVMISMIEHCNFLVDCGSGEYWLYLPDDDRLCPEFLALSVAALDNHRSAAFTFSDHWIIDAEGKVDQAASDLYSRKYHRAQLQNGLIANGSLFGLALHQAFTLQTMLFRREIIEKFRFQLISDPIPDMDLQLRLANSDMPFDVYYCAQKLVEYRLHGGQATTVGLANLGKSCRAIIKSLEQFNRIPDADRSLYNSKLAASYLALALSDAAAGNRGAAKRSLRKSLALNPKSLKAYCYLLLLNLPANWVSGFRNLVGRLRESKA
jgi:glycosyltransferase involved in cell wall biosynthesis